MNIVLLDSYPDTYYCINIGTGNAGQIFKSNVDAKITTAKGLLLRTSDAEGIVKAHLWNVTGTPGVDAVPTGTQIAESSPIDVTTLSEGAAWVEFTFSNGSILKDTYYAITFKAELTVGAINIGGDNTTLTADGNWCLYEFGDWYADNTIDLMFYVYGDTSTDSSMFLEFF